MSDNMRSKSQAKRIAVQIGKPRPCPFCGIDAAAVDMLKSSTYQRAIEDAVTAIRELRRGWHGDIEFGALHSAEGVVSKLLAE